jgi:septal ring factor EnvC (AmiA/AmiB activator)
MERPRPDLLRLGLVALLLALLCPPALAQSREEAQRRLDAIRAQIRSAERQVQATRTEEATELQALEDLDRELLLRQRLLAQYRAEVDSTQAETRTLQLSIVRLEQDIQAARASYRTRARHAYMHGRRNSLALIVASSSINQMIVRARYLQQFAQRRRRQVERIGQKTLEMRTREQAVRASMETTQRLLSQRQSEQGALADRREERSLLVADVVSKRGRLERTLGQRRADARQMEGLVQQLVAQERRRAEEERERQAEAARRAEQLAAERAEAARVAQVERRARLQREAQEAANRAASRDVRERPTPRREANPPRTAPTPGTGASPVANARPTPAPEARPAPPRREPATPPPAADRAESLSGSFRQNQGRLPWPTDGTVTGAFGTRTDPVYGTTVSSIGIDISTVSAAPARAVFEGTVERIGTMASYGTFVMISHGDFTTVYGNLSQVTVARGARVSAGQVIGRAGTAEERRGSTLFFAVFQGGSPTNPMGWLRRR